MRNDKKLWVPQDGHDREEVDYARAFPRAQAVP